MGVASMQEDVNEARDEGLAAQQEEQEEIQAERAEAEEKAADDEKAAEDEK